MNNRSFVVQLRLALLRKVYESVDQHFTFEKKHNILGPMQAGMWGRHVVQGYVEIFNVSLQSTE